MMANCVNVMLSSPQEINLILVPRSRITMRTGVPAVRTPRGSDFPDTAGGRSGTGEHRCRSRRTSADRRMPASYRRYAGGAPCQVGGCTRAVASARWNSGGRSGCAYGSARVYRFDQGEQLIHALSSLREMNSTGA